MANNLLLKTLLKSVMPSVTKFVSDGKLDNLMQELKHKYADRVELQESESIEILITTESDGLEYANIIVMNSDNLQITKLLAQQKLSEIITALFTQADM